ncbi:MAG: tryptophan synthase subunit alpha, partial [Anaerolineales bacterium]
LADGPTIQRSTQAALDNGMTMARCLQAVGELRARGVRVPCMLMGYFNPLLAYGVESFVADSRAAGANGFIVPDLPPEEAGALEAACRTHGMGLAYLLAPTSTEARIRLVAERATGFTYLVSITGVTGARSQLPAELGDFVARVRRCAHTPLAVGFGIGTPEQARRVGAIADGVIVGSKLITIAATADDAAAACGSFVAEMVAALAAAR